jgi:hypothetical protein
VVTIGLYFQQSASVGAYTSASSCASPSDALSSEACRYHGPATVESANSHDPFHASVAFEALPSRTFIAGWPPGGGPAITALTLGGTVDAELWNGKVTRAAGKPTIADPELLGATFYLQGAAISVGAALLILLIWGLALNAWQRRLGEQPGGAPAVARRVPPRPAKLEHVIILSIGLIATAIGVVTNSPYAVIAGLIGVVVGALVAWRAWPK